MGASYSLPSKGSPTVPGQRNDDLTITGMGTEWPSKLVGPGEFRDLALKHYPEDAPWLQELLKVNGKTGIQSRAMLDVWSDPRWNRDEPPGADEVDEAFRQYGAELAEQAARKALSDSNISPSSITHVVAVTATNAGSPGYDQLVVRRLGIAPTAERILLAGAGCSGGLAALRAASDLAMAASLRGKEARVLVIACEICSIQVRCELHASATYQNGSIGPVLFGDGASALVLCNSHGMAKNAPRLFTIVDRRSEIMPEGFDDMSYRVSRHGFLLKLSKNVPALTAAAVREPFQSLTNANGMGLLSPSSFDWALHPGGLAIIKGVQKSMDLPDDAVRASNEIYKTRGNTSSVAVLAVLDRLRSMEKGKKDVIACSVGPGLVVEMALLKRVC
ncbi:chalcone synthase B [Aspergillus tamarii]|uniref:Chalcone synthase B n=1 Tax=Aspergillus tamarii TaxID=41984 RepID=A0A5N6VBQ0_ASPTM|nr:chalcone synthase B [Aspergillus tamarii]